MKIEDVLKLVTQKVWKGIVWHHSLSKDGVVHDWPGICKYHTSFRIDGNIVSAVEFQRQQSLGLGRRFEKPWKAVGYHLGIEFVNGEVEVSPGRSWDMAGAHAGLPNNQRFNADYLGFCAIGNFDLSAPPPPIWLAAVKVTRLVQGRFCFPKVRIIGHREVYIKAGVPVQKSCPGKLWDMDVFRRSI